MPLWLQYVSVGINVGLLIAALKLGHRFGGLESKIDIMWIVFSRRFGNRTEGLE